MATVGKWKNALKGGPWSLTTKKGVLKDPALGSPNLEVSPGTPFPKNQQIFAV